MQTSDPDILALGECAEVDGICYGLVAPLYEMAEVAARHLAGGTGAVFMNQSTATKLKVTGIDLFSAGDFGDGEDREEIVLRDAAAGRLQAPGAEGRPHHRRRCSTAKPPTAPGSSIF